uniref:Putative E3 ubiquitin-protein ligase UBR7 n=1 Tax=Amphiprion ocellaris TaxID=80972 RepID=A0A3Q1C4F7_AMPOC
MATHKDDLDTDEVLANEEELQNALCVLAGSDPENCSYSRGYVKRQAVFACNTCTPSAAQPAGVCLACANKCHDGHDIFELYTKRNFRCDCGNSKFGDFQCHLCPVKDEENVRNHYNHNFNGCYCTCDRPYPDTDDQNDDEMIQCVVCEDWFHSRHLGCTTVEPEELQEMVCEACMNKAPFLWIYAAHFAGNLDFCTTCHWQQEEKKSNFKQLAINFRAFFLRPSAPPVINIGHPAEEEEEVEVDVEDEDCEPSRSGDEEPSTSSEHTKQEVRNKTKTVCKLKELQAQGRERLRRGAVFWPYSWRSELCTCTSCKRAYVAAEVQFLMDQSDTILAYEEKGLDEPFGQHPLMALTSSMDHVQQLEVIYGFNELKTSISAFLEQCVSEGKTVTVEAVHQFFEELRARKRRRTNAGYQ